MAVPDNIIKIFTSYCIRQLNHLTDLILNNIVFAMDLSVVMLVFFRITQYIGDTHNVRTLISMNTRAQNLPLGVYLKTGLANPQD
jgi:hypothetical protein